ncbi:MAG TPA: SoxR reducing system RseC family protein [Sedimentisphaerales bacterium]|nr:SoxR reducing system RseC family protein [Sedimentisphaerales bacterium]
MQNHDLCQGCKQLHECREIYRQLGSAQAPSVARKVVLAFLAPMLVFITSLVVFQKTMPPAAMAQEAQTALGIVLAVAATFICVLITGLIDKRLDKKPSALGRLGG